MTEAELLEAVKTGLGITGTYQDNTLTEYINEVKKYISDAGVPTEVVNSTVSVGVISRGVSDLWSYTGATLSNYFYERVTQLVYYLDSGRVIITYAGDYGNSYPIDIDGAEISADDTVVFTVSNTETILTKDITGVINNTVIITFTNEDAELLTAGNYKWTLKIHKDDAVITAVNNGVLIVN